MHDIQSSAPATPQRHSQIRRILLATGITALAAGATLMLPVSALAAPVPQDAAPAVVSVSYHYDHDTDTDTGSRQLPGTRPEQRMPGDGKGPMGDGWTHDPDARTDLAT